MNTTQDLSLYDIMAEDMDVYIKPGKDASIYYELIIDNEQGKEILHENVHKFAIEGMAKFCRQFLNFYESALKRTLSM